jgi:hypothetical protein
MAKYSEWVRCITGLENLNVVDDVHFHFIPKGFLLLSSCTVSLDYYLD